MVVATTDLTADASAERELTEEVVIRFAGDSGDGMQLTGGQFTEATAVYGNDLATFPDFPAEIRAPAGALFGVSAFQIHFASREVTTAGDALDVLVAMNPAALKTNLADLREGGLLIVDGHAFDKRYLKKAGYESNPLDGDAVAAYRVINIDVTKQVIEAVSDFGLSHKEAVRSKNMWVLGLVMWMYGRDRQPTIAGLEAKFAKLPTIRDANIAALNAGHAYGETAELGPHFKPFTVPKAEVEPGLYRNVTGTEAMAWGLVAASELSDLKLVFASYPITPASALLHTLAGLKEFNVVTFQAEDEIAAACAALGASYAGSLGVTSSSGPGIALKAEAISLACAVELPLIVINTQRAGPSTGMPTKTEQSDLLQALFGRHGDTPLAVIAPATPADCFDAAIQAARIATRFMTPVMLLSDGYLANAAEPWRIPELDQYDSFAPTFRTDPEDFHPFLRDDDSLARTWAVPGTPGLEHRIGGIERGFDDGNISYDPSNHQKMTDIRAQKIDGIADFIAPQAINLGAAGEKLAVVGWGSTNGAIYSAVKRARARGRSVAHIQVRNLWPLPSNLKALLESFDRVVVAEMNTGQLWRLLRSEYLLDVHSLTKITGQPFKAHEVDSAIEAHLNEL
jgi:2-oxoglutarate ferredoxin oxidoreductase subunit alpha